MKTDFNFLASYKMNNKSLAMKSNVSYLITAMIIIMISIIGATTLILVGINVKDGMDISIIVSETADLKIKSKIVADAKGEIVKLAKKQDDISKVNKNIVQFRMLSKNDINAIYGVLSNDVVVKEAIYTNSVLVLTCKSTNKDSPSECAAKLDKQDISVAVTYNGFTSVQKEAENIKTEEINFTLTCIVKEIKGGDAK